jgi:hypothetical protein
MYLLILDFACYLRYDRSLLMVPLDTCNICAISLWLFPWLLSSLTLFLPQSILLPSFSCFCLCSISRLKCSISPCLSCNGVQLLRLKGNARSPQFLYSFLMGLNLSLFVLCNKCKNEFDITKKLSKIMILQRLCDHDYCTCI